MGETHNRPWYRRPLCWLKLCTGTPNSDDKGMWGECSSCGERWGYVTREQVRRYIDRETAKDAARRKKKSK
jgi:hypothetical protein